MIDIMEGGSQAKAIAYCPDCGPTAVPHAIERWKVGFDGIFKYFTKPLEAIWNAVRPIVSFFRPGRLAPAFFRTCAALRLGRIMEHADDKDTWRARVIWEEAERRDIVMREFRPLNLPRDIFYATKKTAGETDTRLFDGLPRPRNAHEAAQNWMDDKGIILKKFRVAGVPVPRGDSARTLAQAEKIFRAIDGPVIVKPSIGSRSRHTYVHITNLNELRHAFLKAKEIAPYVVIEEELPGFVFRITLVGGKVAGVMRREPPHVVGDGYHAVRELMEIENKNPLREGPIFHKLELGEETLATLREKNLTPDSVPAKDQFVILHPKVGRAYGASTTEITDIHPENIKLFTKMAEVLDDPIVGVDFMIEDMARSWREQKCGIIECNSLPFIDLHHYPLKGPARNVAAMVWDLVFPKS